MYMYIYVRILFCHCLLEAASARCSCQKRNKRIKHLAFRPIDFVYSACLFFLMLSLLRCNCIMMI